LASIQQGFIETDSMKDADSNSGRLLGV
jgi:hypothetical protein